MADDDLDLRWEPAPPRRRPRLRLVLRSVPVLLGGLLLLLAGDLAAPTWGSTLPVWSLAAGLLAVGAAGLVHELLLRPGGAAPAPPGGALPHQRGPHEPGPRQRGGAR
ncbi:hypothetical protein [Pseudokineococcus sp. 1T1Z-3]|uniref:hypothetical protein n=1 Tax=Pseudokineococcus sp. 1T1Z-3 TaxID=3132745 RepID=UPI0030ACB2B1